MDVSIVIVNYNSLSFLVPCLTSVYGETSGMEFEVIVVDNASTDGSKKVIQDRFPQVRWIDSGKNLGFAGANNLGLMRACGEFVLLLNPDTVIVDNAIVTTWKFLRTHSGVGAAACKLINAGGNVQPSVRSFPGVWEVFSEATFLYALFPRSRVFGRYYMTSFDYSHSIPVDWASGAFLFLRREAIDAVGLLDDQFFMYSEEMDYCYRLRKAGYSTWFLHSATIIHHWGALDSLSRRVVVWTHGSQLLFFRKHFRGIQRSAMVAIKILGIFLRVLVFAFLGCLPGRRTYRRKASNYARAFLRMFDSVWQYRNGKHPASEWRY